MEQRPRFISRIADEHSLFPGDPFRKSWCMPPSKIVAATYAWGSKGGDREDVQTGTRLVCDRKFLGRVLSQRGADLVLLIKLTRYEAGREGGVSKFTTTAAALRVTKDLTFDYFAGPANQVQQSRF